MADLEQQIAAWRSRLSALVGGNSDFVAELELHLRDAVEDQVRHGVPAEHIGYYILPFALTLLILGIREIRLNVHLERLKKQSAASAGSDRRRVSARSPIAADIAARRSDATVTATPSSRAAARKSGAR